MSPELITKRLSETYREIPQSLLQCLSEETSLSTAGYPFLKEGVYKLFLDSNSLLFQAGLKLHAWLQLIENDIANQDFTADEQQHIATSCRVLKTVIRTASITAPTDLWVLDHILQTWKNAGIVDRLLDGETISAAKVTDQFGVDPDHFDADLHFVFSRGYLDQKGGEYKLSSLSQVRDVFQSVGKPTPMPVHMVPLIICTITGEEANTYNQNTVDAYFSDLPSQSVYHSWIAGPRDIQIGSRIVPLILALRSLGLTDSLAKGNSITGKIPGISFKMVQLLEAAGALDQNHQITVLGERLFLRGPGPFGIIYAYHAYMKHLELLLKGQKSNVWVARGENVAASQDANRKTFAMANDALDRYCSDQQFAYSLYIEHAVGQGEATRQRFERNGEDSIQYFGADLEDAAINKAIESQKKGDLPQNMQFIRDADIGKPEILIEGIRRAGFDPKGSVMIVGNGFHEIREQSNASIITVLEQYCQAGILLIFTEESGLADEDLLQTAWNTYHAGFRYVHELSGQGLRPALDKAHDSDRYSWRKCAMLAGYTVEEEYTTRTRKIFPTPRADGYNPAISVSYFCVPQIT